MAERSPRNFLPQHLLRVTDDFQPSEKMTKPIAGFELLPVVSIEEAVKPLVSLVPDINEMVVKVKEKCHNPKDGLSPDDSASILLYSMEWTPREKSFYIIFNNTLRAEDDEKLKPWHLYMKLFITALEKLPTISQTLYRGVKLNLNAQYPQGKTFVWWGFSSCTTSLQVLQSEQFLGKTGDRTLFSIDCESGKNIQNHSLFPSEDEVLLIAARKFQVTSVLDSGNGLFLIQLKEIESDYPLLGSTFHKIKSGPLNSNSQRESREASSEPQNSALPRMPAPSQFPAPPTFARPPRFPM
jgi:hypothetical protein